MLQIKVLICYLCVQETRHFFEMRYSVIKPISNTVSLQNFVFLLKCSVPGCEAFQSIQRKLYHSSILEYIGKFSKEMFLIDEDPLKYFCTDI